MMINYLLGLFTNDHVAIVNCYFIPAYDWNARLLTYHNIKKLARA